MRGHHHANPYENSPTPSNGNGLADLRVKVATIETRQQDSLAQTAQNTAAIGELRFQIWNIYQEGRRAVASVGPAIDAKVAPIEKRVTALETHWWEPMRPHLWKLYLGLALLGFAFGWKRITGEPLPLRILLEQLMR